MYRLSLIAVCFIGIQASPDFSSVLAQTPHGTALTIACEDCHNTSGWDFIGEGAAFNHDEVGFDLVDGHKFVDCKKCHSTLIFEEAASDCISCHIDVHAMSVGDDCVRCHDERNWLVNNIPELHEINGFPLLGQHRLVSCTECHQSESQLRWDWVGNDCISCHLDDFVSTTEPNHQLSNFSHECAECHSPGAESWGQAETFHLFFPLEGKHEIPDCAECHLSADYTQASPECVSCHMDDYLSTNSPNHSELGYGLDCAICHTGDIWNDATFLNHDDMFFPIFSGEHDGEWDSCTDCHTEANYSTFSCIECHEHNDQNDLAQEHRDEDDFVYESTACYSCHPTGEE